MAVARTPKLSPELVEVLRRLPLDDRPNKLRLAMSIANVKQTDLVEGTGLPQPHVSDLLRGRYQTVMVDTARKFADYFGCTIEDLFPAREAVAS